MEIIRFSFVQMQANCYFLVIDSDCIIIDPADEADFILEELSRRNLTLRALVATHGHFDHVMAAGQIQQAYGEAKVPFYIAEKDNFLLKRLGETAKYFLGYDPLVIPPINITPLESGDLSIGEFSFLLLPTPGHTPGSVCLYFPEEHAVFTGDTLFAGTIGRYDFSYSDGVLLKESLTNLLRLPEETIVYPGHGEETVIGEEREIVERYF